MIDVDTRQERLLVTGVGLYGALSYAANSLPAYRATRVDPMAIIPHES